jgi:vitamin B12/bleomycin/antimicrobial peptide transport system ATP-binding/permease protein
VSSALIWSVNAYQEIARWRANVERLSVFADVLDATERDLEGVHIRLVHSENPVLKMIGVRLMAPDGHALIDTANATVYPGERVAIAGPSGVGKTIMLRAIAGLWPFGSGHIHVPARAHTLFVPQLPYLPNGTLRAAVSYPSPEGTFSDDAIHAVLEALGLGRIGDRLGDTAPWDQQLSPNEQQRLAIARVLLNRPEWVFLDKATSALDAPMEKRVYELLERDLPRSTVISVGHGSEPDPYFTRRWTMEPNEHGTSSLQAA